jgi:chemotaxis family two-component system sensor kinase Cph1
LLMAELDHRVKNTLASIQAMVAQTSRSASSLAAFTHGLDRRIRSMSRAHSLLTQSRWEGVSLDVLIQQELDAYRAEHANVTISGPDVMLLPKAALALSLAIHELATNAGKYGALSAAGGHVDIRWQFDPHAGLELRWQESGGPPVSKPTRRGFGSILIERALSLETGGSSTLSGGTASHASIAHDAPAKVTDIPTDNPPRILIVEDSAMVLMLIEDVVIDLGWDIVGPAMRLPEALKLSREAAIDAALIDVNLDGEMSWDAAAILQDRKIPFVFTTGYDSATVLPERFAGHPVLNKPFSAEDVGRTLQTLLSRH